MGLFSKIFSRNVLYYPGCVVRHAAPDLNENYKEILTKLGIEFLQFDDFVCCGCPVLNAGFKEDFDRLKEKNIDLLKQYGIKMIITPCPACTKMFKQDYELEKEGIKVKHISEVMAENLGKIKDIFKKGHEAQKITFHDPCHLGRHCNIYDEPRKAIIKAGYSLEEFDQNRNQANCCGGGGGVKANFPEVASEIAKKRLKECKTKLLTTACPLCYMHLKENAKDSGINVKDFSEIMKEALEDKKENKEADQEQK